MHISERGIALLKQSEGFSATPYFCPAGKCTIGYGHVIKDGEVFSAGVSQTQAEDILKNDVNETERAVDRLVDIELTQNQFDALVVLSYNIGAGAFENSTLLKCLNENDLQAAVDQWKRWIYANGQVLPGLVTRRGAEVALFLGN
jgi:lysozyme